MFGIIRPCRHRLGGELAEAWTAQLCGLCLALRDDYGQAARIATNYDGLVVSLLVEAQSSAPPARRTAGRCPLRRMRHAEVAVGDCARLAAAVSLILAAARVGDHIDDRDGVAGALGVRPAARRIAERWMRQGADAGRSLGWDTSVLVSAIDRQVELEASVGPGTSPLLVTEPTETAVAAAFEYTAVLAHRPENQAPLYEVGRLFGRVAHLLDAVEDYRDDVARGKWNPLVATNTPLDEVRRLCDDAVLGVDLALDEVTFSDGRLVRRLLIDEVRRAISRTFRPAVARRGTPHGEQDGINFSQQPPYPGQPYPQAGVEQPYPGPGGPPRRGGGGRWADCICCCDACVCADDCCCDCS